MNTLLNVGAFVSSRRFFIADVALIAMATVVTWLLRESPNLSYARWIAFLPYLGITLVVAVPVLLLAELDLAFSRLSTLSDYMRIALLAAVLVVAAMMVGFLYNRLDGVARSLPLLQGFFIVTCLVGVRVALRVRIEARDHALSYAATGIAPEARHETVLLVGWGAVIELFVRSAAEISRGRMRLAGILSPQLRHVGRLVQNVGVVGVPVDVEAVVADLAVHGIRVDRVIVAMDLDRLGKEAREALARLSSSGTISVELLAERLRLSGQTAQDGSAFGVAFPGAGAMAA